LSPLSSDKFVALVVLVILKGLGRGGGEGHYSFCQSVSGGNTAHRVATHSMSFIEPGTLNPLALELDIYSLTHHLCNM
jgi:hypothetical protein